MRDEVGAVEATNRSSSQRFVMREAAPLALSVIALLALTSGCGGSKRSANQQTRHPGTGMTLVSASPLLIAACKKTARAVGYPVPCPMRVPKGLTAYGGRPDCPLGIIGPGEKCPNTVLSWRGWVVGSSSTTHEHLVITASPLPLQNNAKLVNGPAWYPGSRVDPIAATTIHRWRIRAAFVPQATNDGSAFANHVVLIWTVGRHTYGVGFHNVTSIEETLLRDEQLTRYVRLVTP